MTTMGNDPMAERLRQLEQQNRLLKVGLVAILASAVCGALVGRPDKSSTPVQANRLAELPVGGSR